jgi:mono/diheme cytochrome c family protein
VGRVALLGAAWRRRLSLLATLLLLSGVARGVTAQEGINPIPADAASMARGQEIYAQYCAICHGLQGRGDGPLARTLVPRPADLRIHMAEGHTDAQLFDWISNGVPDTPMPGFAAELSVEDRWHVINYLQTFAPAAR